MDKEKRIYLLVGLIFFLIVPFVAFGQEKIELKMMTGPMGLIKAALFRFGTA